MLVVIINLLLLCRLFYKSKTVLINAGPDDIISLFPASVEGNKKITNIKTS